MCRDFAVEREKPEKERREETRREKDNTVSNTLYPLRLGNLSPSHRSFQFLVFACSDSRVSPSHILNFQPGEAFIVRDIANMVPLYDKVHPIFSYTTLWYWCSYGNTQLQNSIRCGGIKGLMSIEDDSAPNKSVLFPDGRPGLRVSLWGASLITSGIGSSALVPSRKATGTRSGGVLSIIVVFRSVV
ncbi:hypothetical protein DY000_02058803 [Brassica cretica]|uniref:Carbonic anhydrase n=1 Tax=Brassica cretica TaxID=69181 RepID=A0ABQ7AQ18_BRACR|nr:hypothetical protein DY000_02058803 [Brassica cretica]